LTRDRRLLGRLVSFAALLFVAAGAHAQDLYTWNLAVLGGVGGSFDVKPGSNFGNASYQLELSRNTELETQVGVRLGHLSLDRKAFGSLSNAGLSYATVAGEYRFQETYYQSGVFLGLGAYRLTGTDASGAKPSKTAIGGSVGFTGEFQLRRWLGLLVEVSGHYVDLREAHIYGMAHGGLVVHF
jgi:hypothetical protein